MVQQAKKAGAQLIIVLNASPYSIDKANQRLDMLKQRISESGLPICYLNLIGGQDELIFDGGSLVINQNQEICAQAHYFEEQLLMVEMDSAVKPRNDVEVIKKHDYSASSHPVQGFYGIQSAKMHPFIQNKLANIYQALVLGIKDYVHKNDFSDVILGLSGGIDSALTLAIAVDALGADHVTALLMPSQYTANMSIEDAKAQTLNHGIKYHVISIQKIFNLFKETLKPAFVGTEPDTTEENIQARIRGMLLMAFSNKMNQMVLTTGNKSELAVGYVTLYGDMAGGFAPLKDVFKTLVYELAQYRNSISHVIPQRVFDRPPSAELAPNQKDEDSLPSYKILDPILELFIEKDLSKDIIVEKGFDETIVKKIIKMVLNNEYKRRQGPPGIKITEKAFGRDRRYPITSKYLK